MALLEVKKAPDGRTLARRRDGKPLTARDRVVARRMIEARTTNGLTPGDVVSEFFTDSTGWLVLVVRRPERLPTGPITIGASLQIVDVAMFIEATIQDLVTYVSARNRGSSHWVEGVLDEKLEQLELCGVKVEIRSVQ